MRVNKFVAKATGLSRRAADRAIQEGRVAINRHQAGPGDNVTTDDSVTLDNRPIKFIAKDLTIMLNKPVGYVCSRQGQGNSTIYDLLPMEYHGLKPVGRLDKDSSGLLLLTSDGDLANQLTHPRYAKTKIYEVTLDKPLSESDKAKIEAGVKLDDYVSSLRLSVINNGESASPNGQRSWQVVMTEGRNRQIRRTFSRLDYEVKKLHRDQFGGYRLAGLRPGEYKELADQ